MPSLAAGRHAGRAAGAAAGCVPVGAGRPQLGDRRAARRAARHRAGDGAEDRRLPHRARPVHLGRRARRDPGHRAGADREPARAGGPRDRPARTRSRARRWRSRRASRSRISARAPRRRPRGSVGRRRRARRRADPGPPAGLCGGAARRCSAGGGGATGSTRSIAAPCFRRSAGPDAPSSSSPRSRRRAVLDPRARGEARVVRAARRSTSPSSSSFTLGRSPPQGAVLDALVVVELPPGPEHGFDERTWLRRHGVHVVLQVDEWKQVGRRGGLGGLADRLRARLARSIAPGLAGERRAVLEGIVLGDDSELSPGLRQDFQASGLYHLLAVSGQNVVLVAAGALVLAWLLGVSRWIGELGALAGIGAYVLAVGAAAVGDPRGDRGLARLARLAGGPAARRLVRAAPRRRSRCSPGIRTWSTTPGSSSRSPRSRRSSRSSRGSRGARGLPAAAHCRLGVAVSLGCGAVDGADPLAPVRLPAASRRPRERARRAGDAGPARARVRDGGPRLGLARRGRRRRVAQRLGRGVHRALRARRSARSRSPRSRAGVDSRVSWPLSCSSAPAGVGSCGGRDLCAGLDRRCRDGRLCLAPMADELKPAYLIAGTDRPKVDRALERLRRRFAPTRSRFTLPPS